MLLLANEPPSLLLDYFTTLPIYSKKPLAPAFEFLQFENYFCGLHTLLLMSQISYKGVDREHF